MVGGETVIMRNFHAILFDFDGVLGKTMEDNFLAWVHAFSGYGLFINKEAYFLIEGFNARRVAEHFLGQRAEEAGVVDELIRLKEKFYMENCTFSFYEGVVAVIEGLRKKGYRLGLVSGANSKRLRRSVGDGFLSHFDVVVTGDRVENCKPHPEPYLRAAAALSAAPSECMVVENAPMGIESAKSAGMFCIAIASTLDKKHLKKADRVIERFNELEGIL